MLDINLGATSAIAVSVNKFSFSYLRSFKWPIFIFMINLFAAKQQPRTSKGNSYGKKNCWKNVNFFLKISTVLKKNTKQKNPMHWF